MLWTDEELDDLERRTQAEVAAVRLALQADAKQRQYRADKERGRAMKDFTEAPLFGGPRQKSMFEE